MQLCRRRCENTKIRNVGAAGQSTRNFPQILEWNWFGGLGVWSLEFGVDWYVRLQNSHMLQVYQAAYTAHYALRITRSILTCEAALATTLLSILKYVVREHTKVLRGPRLQRKWSPPSFPSLPDENWMKKSQSSQKWRIIAISLARVASENSFWYKNQTKTLKFFRL